MATLKRANFANTEEGVRIENELALMMLDVSLSTQSSYSSNSSLYADNSMSFVQKHMAYLECHPKVNVDHYLANLRLMTKIR
jgi:hypothetical protein